MSKLRYVFAILLVSMVTLTGCGKKNSLSPKETIEKAISNMKAAENYKMGMDINVGVKSSGMSVDMSISADADVDVKNGINKMNMAVNMLGMAMETEMYTDSKSEEGKIVTYTKDLDGNWSKETEDATEENEDTTKNFLNIMESGDNLKELKADKENYNYEITIAAEDLQSLMSMTGESSLNVDASELKGDMVLEVSIDKDTYNYSKLSMDMTDMMKSSLDTEDEDVEITKAEFIITFSDYGKVGKIEIPSDIVENATEESDDDYDYDDDYFYVSYDYFTVVEDELSVTIPEGFVEGFMNDENPINYEYETDTDEIFNTCEFKLGAVDEYSSIDEFKPKFVEGYDLSDGTSKTINNLNWEIFVDETYGKTYYAITEKDEKVYLFEYTIESDANQQTCETYYEQILNSIQAK